MIKDILREIPRQILSLDDIMGNLGYLRADSKLPMVVKVVGERGEQQPISIATTADNQMKAYQQVSWVYASVSRICRAAASVSFNVLERKAEQEEEIVSHPFEELLWRPNPFMSRYQLWEQTVGFQELAGNAYWYLNNVGGEPKEIWPLRPDRMRVVADKKRYIKGWVYEMEGRSVTLEAEEVVHFPLWHPRHDFLGLSPVEAAALAGETDYAAADYNRNFFAGGRAVPAGLLNIKEMVGDAEFERIKKEWVATYGAKGTEQKTGFIRGAAAEWQDIGLSHEDMQWLEGRKFNQEEIMTGIYQIPPGLYRESATQANAEVAWRFFLTWVIWPMLVRIGEILTSQVLWRFYDRGLVGRFEDVRPENRELLIQEAGVFLNPLNPILTVDEARLRYAGLGPIGAEKPEVEEKPPEEEEQEKAKGNGDLQRWERKARRWLKERGTADAPFESATLDPRLIAVIQEQLRLAENVNDIKAVFDGAKEGAFPPRRDLDRFEPWAKGLDRGAKLWEGHFREKAKALFRQEKNKILKILKKAGKGEKKATVAYQDFLLQVEDYLKMAGEAWRSEFLPIFQALIAGSAEIMTATWGIEFDVTSPETLAWLERYSMKFADGIVGKTGESVREIIFQGQEEGWTISQMRKALAEKFGEFDRVRAERIARTETIRSSNAGSVEGFRQVGITKKQWYAALDQRTCPFCSEMHGKIVGIEEIYQDQGTEMIVGEGEEIQRLKFDYEAVNYPPLHASCRCVILPIIGG